jgi:hypothetical protein
MDAQSGLSTALSGGQVMVQKHEANHEEKPSPFFFVGESRLAAYRSVWRILSNRHVGY